ncbi:GCN5 family N-acetyltransferase [Kitasatospora herbaricolor]|uniref:GNAT family N-acetyltransferase n=1 Tax=Kitasatospora herbaricolor TaxID=68217 RepID=UPI00174B7BD4|nr:GNAT family N-acetyltransferase [Kitasatospora herbaricolor]MDQ0307307.1 GNAT superfamily N-acetyltransferase [Kitasatospora herbaricolor]GGV30819.1 GCN5 family N-acetyltransferase [Kitasatospora herbaricolor]
MRIRTVTRDELPLLRGIERAAGECFRGIGMPEVADDEPLPEPELARHLDEGTALVVVDATDRPVAYLIAEPVDGALHIEQVSVHPDHARRGLGRALIDHLGQLGGATALTLTTFAEVPWNAPYYARCGFRPLAAEEITPGLREIRRQEAAHGLDRWPRLCMRRDPRSSGAPGPDDDPA